MILNFETNNKVITVYSFNLQQRFKIISIDPTEIVTELNLYQIDNNFIPKVEKNKFKNLWMTKSGSQQESEEEGHSFKGVLMSSLVVQM